MSGFNGTKGKWFVGIGDPNGVELNAYRIQSDDIDRWDICAVWDDVPNSEANALLISKAPEMLEMLMELKDYLSSLEITNEKLNKLIKTCTEL